WFFWQDLEPYVAQGKALFAARASSAPATEPATQPAPATPSTEKEKEKAEEAPPPKPAPTPEPEIEDPKPPEVKPIKPTPRAPENKSDGDLKPDFGLKTLPVLPDKLKPVAPAPTPEPKTPLPKADLLPPSLRGALDWIAKNQEADGHWETGMGDNRDALVA